MQFVGQSQSDFAATLFPVGAVRDLLHLLILVDKTKPNFAKHCRANQGNVFPELHGIHLNRYKRD